MLLPSVGEVIASMLNLNHALLHAIRLMLFFFAIEEVVIRIGSTRSQDR